MKNYLMRDKVKEYIDLFNKTLNMSGICWWIIDFEENPEYFYCNNFMKETFYLDKRSLWHSIEETCPIAGDYNKNIETASQSTQKAKLVIDEYKELINLQTDEYNNNFPYYNDKLNQVFYFSSRAKVLEINDKNEVSILYGIIEDITTQEIQRQEIKEYTDIINKYVITSTTDIDGIIRNVSDAFYEISAYTKSELIGKNHNILRHPDTPTEVYRDMWKTITSGKVWSGEFKNKKKDGSDYWLSSVISPQFDDKNNIKGFTAIQQDITDKKTIEALSKKDKLTNLYNRMKLDESLNHEIKSAIRYNTKLSLIIIDIDYFKLVNDTYGHLVGDKVLIQTASILKNNIRQSDIIGRWGGEEFIVICPNSDINAAKQLAEKLRITMEEFEFDVVKNKTASFGVSQLIENDNINSLIERADNALYKAKESGRNRVESG